MNENNTYESSETSATTLSTIAKSRETTQRCALDTSTLTTQVMTMSGSSEHEKLISKILADDTISIAEKIELIHQENDAFDDRVRKNTDRAIRAQTAQTRNVNKSDAWIVVGITASVAGLIYYLRTPEGQKAVSSLTTSITKLLAA